MSVITSTGRTGNYNNCMNAPSTKERCDIYRPTLQLHEWLGTALECTLADTIIFS